MSKSDEKPFGSADIAEPVRVSVLDHFAYELRAALGRALPGLSNTGRRILSSRRRGGRSDLRPAAVYDQVCAEELLRAFRFLSLFPAG